MCKLDNSPKCLRTALWTTDSSILRIKVIYGYSYTFIQLNHHVYLASEISFQQKQQVSDTETFPQNNPIN